MNLAAAETLALELMKKHNLLIGGWRFTYDNAKRRFGVCRYRCKQIGLSKSLVLLNDEVAVRDTILHEIAHALTPNSGHGYAWKRKCIEIGCKPERCYSSKDTEIVKGTYQATCGACGKTHNRFKAVKSEARRSCNCQRGISWDKRVLLTFVKTTENKVVSFV